MDVQLNWKTKGRANMGNLMRDLEYERISTDDEDSMSIRDGVLLDGTD